MFSCNVNAKTLLDETVAELGLYEELPRASLRAALNEAIGRLYIEVVREEAEIPCSPIDGVIKLSTLSLPADNASLRAEDILRIRKGLSQIHYLPPHRFLLVKSEDGNFYTVRDQSLIFTPTYTGHALHLIYRCRPRSYSERDEGRVLPVPDEYVTLLRAKLRGEAFKLANEDALAAKWLGEYNAILPAFAAYCERVRRPLS